MFIIAPAPLSPLLTCGGDELEISSSTFKEYANCSETSKEGEDGCDKAFNGEQN